MKVKIKKIIGGIKGEEWSQRKRGIVKDEKGGLRRWDAGRYGRVWRGLKFT